MAQTILLAREAPLAQQPSTPAHRQFTKDNNCTVEFDAFSFYVKDFLTRHIILRCDRSGDIFPVTPPSSIPHALLSVSPSMWHQHLRHPGYAYKVGFSSSRCDLCLFIYQYGYEVAYLLIYDDDIVLTTSSTNLLHCIISSLHKEFDMTDLGALNYFLRIFVTRDSTSMFLSQKIYALDLLDREHMANYNQTRTRVNTKSKLDPDWDPIFDLALYCSLRHLEALKRVLRYIRCTLDFGLKLYASTTGDNLISWSRYRYTDIFTKGLLSALFEELCTSLSVRSSPA
nr:hypothetical protein [Tanacetum cinerariifolium]